MKLRYTCLLLFLLLFAVYAKAQPEANHWYFGQNAGLDFNLTTGNAVRPVPLTNGSLNSFEAAATISDAKGRLQFYTDGVTVWNRNHQPMPNGRGLLGHNSTSQGALIVPQPGSTTIYYVFTQDAIQNNLVNGLRYSIVDMSKNDGLGDVVTKNEILRTPTTEKLTAVKHSNCRDVWIVAHEWGNNDFISFLLTPGGLQTVAVTTSVGRPHISPGGQGAARGCMKLSPDGKKLALGIYNLNGWVELFDFNNTTGEVSNPIVLPTPTLPSGEPYGIEFSSNSRMLYAGYTQTIIQYDLSNLVVVGRMFNTSAFPYGSLQVGTDGNLYVARDGMAFLDVLKNANAGFYNTANYMSISLNGRVGRRSLPSFVQSNFAVPSSDLNIGYTMSTCSLDFRANAMSTTTADAWRWDFGDPDSGAGNLASGQSVSHRFSKPGTYTISLSASFNGGCLYTVTRTLTFTSSTADAGRDQAICYNDSTQIGRAASAGYTYQWSPATNLSSATSANPVFYKPNLADSTQTYRYILQATDRTSGCVALDTVVVRVNPQIKTQAGADRTVCSFSGDNAAVQIGAAPLADHTYKWTPSTGLDNTSKANPLVSLVNTTGDIVKHTYYLEATNTKTGCKGRDTIVISVKPRFAVDAGSDKKGCSTGAALSLGTAPKEGYKYSWSPVTGLSNASIANPTLQLTEPQSPADTVRSYILAAELDGCIARDTVKVTIIPLPGVTGITGKSPVCPFESLEEYRTDNKPGYSYRWLVTGGTIASGQGTATVRINWQGTNPAARVRVVPVSYLGCSRDTVSLAVSVNAQQKIAKPEGMEKICYSDRNRVGYKITGRTGDVYTWYASGGQVVQGQGTAAVSVSWDTVGTGRLWVSGSNANPVEACISSSDTLRVSILPSPDTTARIAGTFAVCEGTAGSVYTIKGLEGSVYNWKIGGGKLVSGQGTNRIVIDWPEAGAFPVEVTETTKDQCIGKPVTATVTVNPLPRTVFNLPSGTICPQKLNNFAYTATGQAGSSFQWKVTGGTITGGQGTASIRVNWNLETPKSISVQETAATGCKGAAIERNVLFDNASVEMVLVTVDPANENVVTLNWKLNNATLSGNEVTILRRQAGASTFELLARVPKTTTSYTDTKAATRETVYEYRVELQNACGDTLRGFVHNNMVLKAEKTEVLTNAADGKITLSWNAYNNWQNGVDRYEIWRKLDGESAYTYHATTNTPGLVLTNVTEGFKHCFKIKAVEKGGNRQEAWSAESCVEFEHPLVIPNVITPNGDGYNETWTVSNILLYKASKLEIYNRYGQKVYSREGYDNEWNADGLSGGVYFYRLTTEHRNQEFRGSITVIK